MRPGSSPTRWRAWRATTIPSGRARGNISCSIAPKGTWFPMSFFPCPAKPARESSSPPPRAATSCLDRRRSFLPSKTRRPRGKAWGEIFEKTGATLPSIEKSKVIASYAGLRAVGGEDFEISFSKKFPRWLNLIGIQSPGLTAAPAIAKKIVELLKKNGLICPHKEILSSCQSKEILFRADRVICRCEEVGKKEILAAVQDGATSLDGVKLRTRATMGRCQGGTCRASILTILSEELGIPLDEVRKNGPGSELLAGPVTKILP